MENGMILEKLAEAEMVLVGLGEDFDDMRTLRENAVYEEGCRRLAETGLDWLIPGWNEFCLDRLGKGRISAALEKLSALVQGKNHFMVSVSTYSGISSAGRVVMPCGSPLRKQCAGGCKASLADTTEEDRRALESFFARLYEGGPDAEREDLGKKGTFLLGKCETCCAPLVLNTVYAENYDEEGYLGQWKLYTKWLQGTLNRKLLVLELGAGMRFPSVIRWPFEKAAFFNQKAFFCRVNGKLYQLTKELSEKGCGISKNAIDWLEEL